MRKLAMTMIFAAMFGQAVAQTGETPESLEGARTITAEQAKALIEGGGIALDVRKKASFVEARLPKAKSIRAAEHPETKEFDTSGFGPKETQLIIYGHGSDGWSSVSAVRGAVKAGYVNVHWLRGGFQEWSKAGLATEQ